MKVAYVGGYWGPNIGNGFFNVGADYVLKQVFGTDNVTMVFDHPAYITQWDTNKGNPPWAIDYISHLNVDYIVMLGPVISRAFLNIWKKTIINLIQKGTRYMILSAGMMKYDEAVLEECKRFFEEYPPFVLTTRDHDTYEQFRDCAKYAYDGICFAFYLPDVYKPIPTDFDKTLVLNFDKILEPEITVANEGVKADKCFEFERTTYAVDFHNVLSGVGLKTDRFTDALVYILSLFPRDKRPVEINGYTIIRTDHRFAPMLMRKVYRYNNSFCADIPHAYAQIYAQATLTLSDRVHACAATLAYGNPAMMFAKTGRSALLERVGAKGITEQPVSVDLKALNEEKKCLVDWMKGIEY